jgi:hypothetical protein
MENLRLMRPQPRRHVGLRIKLRRWIEKPYRGDFLLAA